MWFYANPVYIQRFIWYSPGKCLAVRDFLWFHRFFCEKHLASKPNRMEVRLLFVGAVNLKRTQRTHVNISRISNLISDILSAGLLLRANLLKFIWIYNRYCVCVCHTFHVGFVFRIYYLIYNGPHKTSDENETPYLISWSLIKIMNYLNAHSVRAQCTPPQFRLSAFAVLCR